MLARSGIGYGIFNEAVDAGYLNARLLEENEMKNAMNLAKDEENTDVFTQSQAE
ncbi:MAG: hypothetical protein R2741_01870 [Methanolobus sp.]